MRISDWSSDVCSSDLHADVVEEKLRRIGLVLPDLVEVAAALESFAVGLDEDDRHALPRRLYLGVGLDADEDQVGVLAVGDEGLRPVDDIMIAILLRGRAHPLKVGAGARLDRKSVV